MTRHLAVITLGGTIAMGSPGDDGGAVATSDGSQLLKGIPVSDDVNVHIIDVRRHPSSSLTLDHLVSVINTAHDAVDDGAEAIVVTQGTDTMEETAWVWDLLWDRPEPFVVTGAMRTPMAAGADGDANLSHAMSTALAPQARELGVLVVLNDRIHAARFVAKRHSSDPDAFVSTEVGPIGRLVEGIPVIMARPTRRPAISLPTRSVRVPLLTATLDPDDFWLNDSLVHHADALMIAGNGVGHLHEKTAEHVIEIVAHIPVVMTSRTGAGWAHHRTYGGAGTERQLLAHGVLPAGRLNALKARLLTKLILGQQTATRNTLKAAFSRYGDYHEPL